MLKWWAMEKQTRACCLLDRHSGKHSRHCRAPEVVVMGLRLTSREIAKEILDA